MALECFPVEILEQIVRDERVSYSDLSQFIKTCRRFKEVGDNNDTWMQKFQIAFPQLIDLIPKSIAHNVQWKREVQKRLKVGSRVGNEVSMMSSKFFSKTELSSADFRWFDELMLPNDRSQTFDHLYIIDELANILRGNDPNTDLTRKHYAEKCLKHVKHRLIKPECSAYLEDGNSLTYEAALVLVSQWCQPSINVPKQGVSNQLDHLASSTLAHLLENHPEHPIFSMIRTEQEDRSKVNLLKLPKLPKSITSNIWNSKDSRLILDSANHILFTIEGFTGNSDDYYNADNSFIDIVLAKKLGIPITLCLLYSCVLSRLGVCCIPVNFPGHFLLKWQEHPEAPEESNQFTLIDAFDGGRQLTGAQARERSSHLVPQETSYQVATPLAVAQRMLRNLINIGANRSRSHSMGDPTYGLLRNSLELMIILETSDVTQYIFMLSRVYLSLNINHEEVMSMLQEIREVQGITDQVDYLMNSCQMQMEERDNEEKKEPQKRGVAASFPHGLVEFWVGQVCRHKKYHYLCVIHGWDPVCTASKSWISHMGVHKLQNAVKQPFYNVLGADGSNRYAAQENLVPIKPVPVQHPEIGRYFKSFDEKLGYRPNKELTSQFPDEKQTVWTQNEEIDISD